MGTIYGNEKKEYLRNLISAETLRCYTFVLTGIRLAVRNVSLWKINHPWQVPRRKINDVLIWLVKEGAFTASAGEKIYSLSAGQGVIVPEYVSHGFDFAPDCRSGRVFVIHADIFPYSGRGFPGCMTEYRFSLKQPEQIFSQLERAVALNRDKRETACLYARNPIRELLLDCAADNMFSAGMAQVEDPRILAAIDFFRNNSKFNISIADAAGEAGLGEVQFRNLFKKYSGISPAVYLKNLRLRRASELLIGTPLPIKVIAAESGFNSESYFCLVFRKYYGVSPEIYRKKSFNL